MMILDLLANIEFRQAFPPKAAVTNDTAFVSNIIDMLGYKSCTFLINHGTNADGDVVYTNLLEDGADSALGDNAAVADEFMHGTELGSNHIFSDDNEVHVLGYHGFKRYVRLTVTPANNTGNAFISGIAALGGASIKPVPTQND